MQQLKGKEKESTLLVLGMALLALACLGAALWAAASSQFKGGTDDLFFILVALLLAVVFAVIPLMWAYEKGYISNLLDVGDESQAAAAHAEAHEHGSTTRQNLYVWGGLLALTAVEVFLAYMHIPLTLMLIIVMVLSIIKAALIVAYFMHLKFERMSLVLTIVPTLVVLLCLFAIFFPDSFRLLRMR